ncbi:hypothetical protein NEOLEDRAFT_1129534 [Neolentinus lepideus HHB14362 ss-1]|uniref:Family A G protein-coupled receptor-like protein n=1 Tax=Neolentinus lepideus HHB14362 ss-1 TaxID=1314782 RepID=A0A165UIF0_9AGAM|nr:hypothetical protein NEOLEDRAFT_1129534 [Neolentinus lepideus HHB14362 ss-1]
MSSLNWNQQSMVILLVSTYLYGAYTMIFGTCLYALIFRQKASPLRLKLLMVTVALYLLSTAQAAITFWQDFVTTDLEPDGSDGGDPALKHVNLQFALGSVIGDMLVPFANLIADGLLIWRCYVLWDRRPSIVVVPTILLLATTACGFAFAAFDIKAYSIRLVTPLGTVEPASERAKLATQENATIVAMSAASCVTNVLMSGLIAFRIWKLTRNMGERKRRYLRLAWLLLETGALYSMCLVLYAVFGGLNVTSTMGSITLGNGVVTNISQQLVGIIPTVIILLVALGKTVSDQTAEYSVKVHQNFRKGDQLSTIQFARQPSGVQTSDATCEVHSIEPRDRSDTLKSSDQGDPDKVRDVEAC